ncbi:hypothetical protein H7F33_02945 [Pedobacter sp. PAMC26386]|nr:hypothetical protein H7F33_02945 [Pedobacter sp. PAMC26386]
MQQIQNPKQLQDILSRIIKWTNIPLPGLQKLIIQVIQQQKNKTILTEGYRTGEIAFGGYYVTVIWGCGSDCISGVMVDVRNGKVYDLPLNEETSFNDCHNSSDFNNDDRLNTNLIADCL